ncbi:AMP-binding protein [Bradyrhizobium sp. 190]|nr:AMP-binding protein [Bradyrhizobium sp. 190]
MTFKEIYYRVQEVAGALAEAAVEPGDRIGLMLNSSLEHIELYLAIAWLGAPRLKWRSWQCWQ